MIQLVQGFPLEQLRGSGFTGHLAIRPYKDSFMNVLEGSVLTYSMVALIMTLSLGRQF